MKKHLSAIKQQGFTLIELLVVIGILGILAAALIATIDPFEQLKKGQDSNTKNTLVEFVNGNIRYYTTHNAFPWDPTNGANCNGGVEMASTQLCAGGTPCTVNDCVTALINDSELKDAFSGATGILKEIYVTYDAATQEMIGCFRPQSVSQRRDPNTKFNQDGSDVATPTTDCEGYGGATQCYWCTR